MEFATAKEAAVSETKETSGSGNKLSGECEAEDGSQSQTSEDERE